MRPAFRRRFTICRRTIRPARRSTATTAASAAWARPTCSAPTAPTSISPKMARPTDRTKAAASDRKLSFETETAKAQHRSGRRTACSRRPRRSTVEFLVHRDRQANAARDRNPGQKILLEGRAMEPMDQARFRAVDAVVRARTARQRHLPFLSAGSGAQFSALCDARSTSIPRRPPCKCPSRRRSSRTCRKQLGLFYTTGFQEDHKARTNGVFNDDEFLRQASMVLEERLALFEYAVRQLRRRPVVLLFLQQRSAVAHVLVGLRRKASDPHRPPRRKSTSATSTGSIRGSTPSSATSSTATAARRPSSS